MNPLVSILMPTYERPRYFEQALQSALRQTYQNTEIVVSDNSESDATERIVRRYQAMPGGGKIRYIRNPINIGPIDNIQQCLDQARGEYVNYLNDDDLFHPRKIERMMRVMGFDRQIALVTSQRRLIDEQGRPLYVPPMWTFKKLFPRDTIVDGREFTRILLKSRTNYIGEPTTVLFRKKCLKEPFGMLLGKQVFFAVDFATWLNLLQEGKGAYLVQPLSYLRYHPNQLSQNEYAKQIAKMDREAFENFARKKGYVRVKKR